MAEQPSATPVEVVTSESDVVLATKLHVPGLAPGFVPRPRLVDRLAEGLERRLILICAPAGFGKTSLLVEWINQEERPVAWLSLDAGDNDPARFWRHTAAALDRVRPGIAERLTRLLSPPAPPSFDGVVSALINELAARPDQVLLVLDDYHLVESQPVHASLTFLLEHLPPGLHLLVASRADPPLPLARLRAGGHLAELRAADLRFTTYEAAALLREAVGSDLSDATVSALAARTEGWVAGLQLAGLSLREKFDTAGFVTAFSGSHRYVLDYLTEEVLGRQPEQVRSFLLETSVLERLSGPLCDAVTNRTDGQTMLERVERANLFLVPLDEVRGWWRYHHLFADLLRAHLKQERVERVPQLHRNAAAWYEQHGLADDAVRHALEAGDATWAARLIERHTDALVLRGEGATVRRWLASLPAELTGSRPRLLLAQAALALVGGGQVDAVEATLDAAERAFAGMADEPYEPSAGRAASLLANVPASIAGGRAHLAELRGDAEATIAFASRTLAELGEGEWMLESLARGHLAMGEWLRGRLPQAEHAFSSLLGVWLDSGEATIIAWGCHALGQVQRAQGRLDAALRTYHRTLEVTAGPDRPVLPAAGVAYVGMANVARERGELRAARDYADQGIQLCRQLAYTQPLAAGLAALAWIRQAEGDLAGAREAIREAERVAPSAVADLLNPVPAQRARLRLAQGDIDAVVDWVAERGIGAEDELTYSSEGEYLVLARVLLAQDQPDRALGLLQRLQAAAATQGRTGSLIEIRALQALALAAAGDSERAVAVLAEALTLACPDGYVRLFADEGAPMNALLRRLVSAQRTDPPAASGVPVDCLARLLRGVDEAQADRGTRQRAAAAVPGLVEPLTARELEVLGQLAAGRSNQRIAEEFVVTLDTVKKHVSRVLDKLGATNRTEAVVRARKLGLID